MKFSKGDKVCSSPGGVVMEVMAASGKLALCSWSQDGERQQSLFELASLVPAGAPVQQQFQQQPGLRIDRACANDEAPPEAPQAPPPPQA